MRVFAVSDIHVDYDANARWIVNISERDHLDDVLIVAGDISDRAQKLEWCLLSLRKRFKVVLFVPGNHDLWVVRERTPMNSLHKFEHIRNIVEWSGASMEPFISGNLSIVPLLGWYDYSFGAPSNDLKSLWMDFRACCWPGGLSDLRVAAYFAGLNEQLCLETSRRVITYSHFLPRIDLMPDFVPAAQRMIYPVLGSARLDSQLRRLRSSIHIYGHSHINRNVNIDGVTYVNSAYGYPSEAKSWITARRMAFICEC